MRGLTTRQRDVLHAIRDYLQEHGRAPTFSELASEVGGRAVATVYYHACALRQKGFLTWEPELARTLKPTGKLEE